MKSKNILALLLALIFAFTSALPAFAGEGELVPEQGEETAQQPEDKPAEDNLEPDPGPDPDEELPPVLPEPPDEGEDVPPVTEETPDPDTEETPDTGDDEDPDTPRDPTDDETPDEDEEPPEDPEDEEVPDEEDSEEEESDSDSEEEALTIDVLVPASGQVVINPYHMKVAASTGETTEQIIHEPQALLSYTDRPLQVSARVIGRLDPESEARFVFGPPADDALDKEIFMYVEFQNDPALWTGAYGDWPNQILVTDWGMEKENVMALDAFGVGYFRLFGAMTNFPDTMWASVDAPDVIVAFSFTEIPGAVETNAFPEAFPETLPEAPPVDIPEVFPENIPGTFPEGSSEVPTESENTEM